jgi:hypothetical protein
VGIEQVLSAVRQCDAALVSMERHRPHQALLAEVTQIRVARVGFGVAEIVLGDDAESADRAQGSDVVTIQFVPVATVDDDLAIEPAWELEGCDERIPRVPITRTPIALTRVEKITRIFVRWTSTELHPVNVDTVAGVLRSIPRIAVKHD